MPNSLIEPPFIPAWGRKFREAKFFIYNGLSMRPLLQPGDMLCVYKASFQNLHLGDIVLIDWEMGQERQYVVHRMIAVRATGPLTQGDNNLKPDVEALTAENFIGLVTHFERRGRIHPLRGGTLGWLYARIILVRNWLWLFIKRLGWRVYRILRQSGVIAKVWRPAILQIRVATGNGSLVKYCHGKCTVARWWPETQKFNVKKPFDLVIFPPKPL